VLKAHIRSVHDRIREVACPQCGHMFAQTHTMRKHMIKIHKIVVEHSKQRAGRKPATRIEVEGGDSSIGEVKDKENGQS